MSENFGDTDSKNQSLKGASFLFDEQILPAYLKILPIKEGPLFPGTATPIIITGKKRIAIIEQVLATSDRYLGLNLIEEKNEHNILKSKLIPVGTVVKIDKAVILGENTVQIMCQALKRYKLLKKEKKGNPYVWEVEYQLKRDKKVTDTTKAYGLTIRTAAKELLNEHPIFSEKLHQVLQNSHTDEVEGLIDSIAPLLSMDKFKLQKILSSFDIDERSILLLEYLKEEIVLQKIQTKINGEMNDKVQKNQKDYFLRQQLKAIQEELGEGEAEESEDLQKFADKLKDLKLNPEAKKEVKSKIKKIKAMSPQSADYAVLKTWLEILTDLPWGKYTEDSQDIKKAAEILNQDHHGMDDVKDHVLQHISTLVKRGSIGGTNLLLVGPPGVGKTSIGKSVARALGRKFFRFSLGGARDEAEIKGHRRTYVGALPGKIIESIRRSGSSNPVILLDEIDKMGQSYAGDPAAALLEVLDPEQNKNFLDHYVDVPYDLSKVLFISTANQVDTIPPALLDRMEIVELAGYISEEKVEIAKKHLVPDQLNAHGLKKSELKISNSALHLMANGYAREAGVRGMEKLIKKVMRKTTLKQARENIKSISITSKNLTDYLGQPRFAKDELYNKNTVGSALGMAYTGAGGTTLYIEAAAVPSTKGGLILTGKLGEVMKESATIAKSYVQQVLKSDKVAQDFFDKNQIHLHVPEGATPKDGPSAGITMATALYSLITGKLVKPDLSMTGELTLTGKVLPIGGVREKVTAAKRAGLKKVILPEANKKDYEELPDYIRKGLIVFYADFYKDVLLNALVQKK